jgi:hypothetical protein
MSESHVPLHSSANIYSSTYTLTYLTSFFSRICSLICKAGYYHKKNRERMKRKKKTMIFTSNSDYPTSVFHHLFRSMSFSPFFCMYIYIYCHYVFFSSSSSFYLGLVCVCVCYFFFFIHSKKQNKTKEEEKKLLVSF